MVLKYPRNSFTTPFKTPSNPIYQSLKAYERINPRLYLYCEGEGKKSGLETARSPIRFSLLPPHKIHFPPFLHKIHKNLI